MATHSQWYIPGHIIYSKHEGVIGVEETEANNQRVIELMREYPEDQSIHIIFDVTDIEENQVSVMKARNLVSFVNEPNLGEVVVVNDNRVVNFIASIVFQFSKISYHTTRQIDQALEFLAENHNTIPWDQNVIEI